MYQDRDGLPKRTVDELLQQTPTNGEWADDRQLFDALKDRVSAMDADRLQQKWPRLLPLLLQSTTHFKQQLSAVTLLRHVLHTLPSQFVQRNGLDRLLLHHLRKLFYQTEADLLRETFETLLVLCSKSTCLIHPEPIDSSTLNTRPNQWKTIDHFEPDQGVMDQITSNILDSIQMTSDRTLKVTLVELLPQLYRLIGRRVWKHTSRLLDVHSELLNAELGLGNRHEKVLVLRSLNQLALQCTSMAVLVQAPIFEILLKLAFELNESNDEAIQRELNVCFDTLRQMNQDEFDRLREAARQLPEFRSLSF
jgi:hypothetical protein